MKTFPPVLGDLNTQKVFVGTIYLPILSRRIFLYPISNWNWDAICPQNVELLTEHSSMSNKTFMFHYKSFKWYSCLFVTKTTCVF